MMSFWLSGLASRKLVLLKGGSWTEKIIYVQFLLRVTSFNVHWSCCNKKQVSIFVWLQISTLVILQWVHFQVWNVEDFEEHRNTDHNQSFTKSFDVLLRFVCDYCDRGFTSQGKLNDNTKIVVNEYVTLACKDGLVVLVHKVKALHHIHSLLQ